MVGIDPLSLLRFDMIMKSIAPLMILTALLLGLPMLGATSTGHPISLYLEFPPHTRYVQHAPFSWSAFALLVTLALLVGAAVYLSLSTAPGGQLPDHRPSPFSLVGLGIRVFHTLLLDVGMETLWLV